jgi:hypothetical protein
MTGMAATLRTGESRMVLGESGIARRCNDLVRCVQGALSHGGRCVKDRHVIARPARRASHPYSPRSLIHRNRAAGSSIQNRILRFFAPVACPDDKVGRGEQRVALA